MNIKYTKLFQLTLALGFIPSYSDAAEERKKDDPAPVARGIKQISSNMLGFSALQPFLLALQSQYLRACELPDHAKQASAFDKIVQSIDLSLKNIGEDGGEEALKVCKQLKATSLRQRAIAIHNLLPGHKKKYTARDVSILRDSATCIKESVVIFTELQHEKEVEKTKPDMAQILTNFSLACSILFIEEKEPDKAINLMKEALQALCDCHTLKSGMNLNGYNKILCLSLNKSIELYFELAGNLERVFLEEPSMMKYKRLVERAKLIETLAQIMDTRFLKPLIPFNWAVEFKSEKHLTRKEGYGQRKNSPFLADPQTFMTLLWSSYCAALKEAEVTLNLVSKSSSPLIADSFQKRSAEHFAEALAVYKANVYQNEYAQNPIREQAFIAARLADLVGDDVPLKEFYRQIRLEGKERQRERIVQLITAKREERRLLEEEQQRKRAEDKGKEEAESLPTLAPAAPLPALALAVGASSLVPAKQPGEEVAPRKAKEKTRGVARPSLASAPSRDESGQEPSLENREKTKVLLAPKYGPVLLGLIGETRERNFSVTDVKSLLVSLGCKVQPGHGVHEKATAPNQKVWIVPKNWDGPIPHYYRHQLNQYLHDMDIDLDDIVSHSRGIPG